MAINAAAKRNHDQLFGGHASTLALTDPELIEYFDNFAFDEALTDAAALDESLDVRTRLLVQPGATLARAAWASSGCWPQRRSSAAG